MAMTNKRRIDTHALARALREPYRAERAFAVDDITAAVEIAECDLETIMTRRDAALRRLRAQHLAELEAAAAAFDSALHTQLATVQTLRAGLRLAKAGTP